jgi:2-polyprenyl-3-methyl-5-hydroxy-6-metoxy-1,4-benzoquinol methylase
MSTSASPVRTVSELRDSIVSAGSLPPEYVAAMLHKVPVMQQVKNRAAFLVERTKGLVVLDIGCTGPISQQIKAGAKKYYGVDQKPGDWTVCDIDHGPHEMPKFEDVEIVVASEVLEHLANPGFFLFALKGLYSCPVYITVPNAGAFQMRDDREMVNKDHVAWYSYTTLATLLKRYGYTILEGAWYHGPPYKAEGLILKVQGI